MWPSAWVATKPFLVITRQLLRMLYPSCFWEIWALCVTGIYLYIYLCVSWAHITRRIHCFKYMSNFKEEVKHKAKRMVKVVKSWNLPSTTPSSLVDSFLHIVFTFFVKVFWTNQNLDVLKKCPIFLYSILSQILKLARPSLRLVVLMKSVTSSYCKVCS